MTTLKPKLLFNPDANDDNIQLFGADTTNIMYLNNVKFTWAQKLYKRMREQFWTPEIVDLTQDKLHIKKLTEAELRAYKGILGFLVFLDSLQSNNLANIIPYVTAPEAVMCLVEQESQEVNHCLAEGTEILTKDGFIDFKDITETTKVAAYSVDGTINYEVPSDIINEDYKGDMYEISTASTTQFVTPNHRVICVEKKGSAYSHEIVEYTAEELFTRDILYDLDIIGFNNDGTTFSEHIVSVCKQSDYKGTIHCVTVSTGMIICKQEGSSVFVTGNSNSYQTIFESIFSDEEAKEIYYYYKENKILLERNSYIAKIYQEFLDDKSWENFVKVMIADLLLEGLYFYNGFQFFYNLASRGLMNGTADMIRLIQLDEVLHIGIFQNILKEMLKKASPEEQKFILKTLEEMTEVAIQQEIEWSMDIMGEGILGINKDSIKDYTYYLAHTNVLNPFGIKKYEEYKNPYRHLDKIANLEGGSEKKGNFFEANSNSYSQVNALKGFSDF